MFSQFRLATMLGLFDEFKKSALKQADEHLDKEFGVKLNKVPMNSELEKKFYELTKNLKTSQTGYTAVYYKCVVFALLLVCKKLADGGDKRGFEDAKWLVEIYNRSIYYSMNSGNHEQIQKCTHWLDSRIEPFFEYFGFKRKNT